jgi:hypothetical protein
VDLNRTRIALHGVASGTIELRVVPGGLAAVAAPDLRVQGVDLISEIGPGGLPLQGRDRRLLDHRGAGQG